MKFRFNSLISAVVVTAFSISSAKAQPLEGNWVTVFTDNINQFHIVYGSKSEDISYSEGKNLCEYNDSVYPSIFTPCYHRVSGTAKYFAIALTITESGFTKYGGKMGFGFSDISMLDASQRAVNVCSRSTSAVCQIRTVFDQVKRVRYLFYDQNGKRIGVPRSFPI